MKSPVVIGVVAVVLSSLAALAGCVADAPAEDIQTDELFTAQTSCAGDQECGPGRWCERDGWCHGKDGDTLAAGPEAPAPATK